MAVVFEKTKGLTDAKLHYCPGCAHGIVHRLVAEVLEEMGELGNSIVAVPVGCAVFANNYFNIDAIQCAHGRAPATATGIKRVHPEQTDNYEFGYRTNFDLCDDAAARGEKITTIFINNGIYGMTGGQMAPTTLPGMKATTAQNGRDPKVNGNPLRVSEMLASLTGPAYIERVSISTPAQVAAAKKAIRKAFEIQKQGLGFTFIEVVASCPTNWGLTPVKAMEFVREKMIPYYPLGVYKDITVEEGK